MNRRRLVFVTRRFWPFVGSAEKGMANIAYGMRQLGYETEVLTARWEKRWPRTFAYRGVPVTRLDQSKRRGWGTIRYMRQLARWLRERREEIDAVVVSMLRYDAYAVLGALRGSNVPVIVRVERGGQQGDCQWHRDTALGARIRSRCRDADALVAATSGIRNELIGAGLPGRRIHVVRGGVEIPKPWSPSGQRPARRTLLETHDVFSLPKAAPLVICGGPLERSEGVFELIEAWKQVTQRWPSARVWILGDGPHGPKLWERIKRLQLESNVVLPGSFDETDNVLRAANLFVRPAHDHGASFDLFEAMSLGLPIVASDIAGHRELLTGGETAELAPPGNADKLALALIRMLEDRVAAERMGAAVRRKAEAEFSLARVSQQFGEIIAATRRAV